jgi:hypothetical protein
MSKWSKPKLKEGEKSPFIISAENAEAAVRELLDFYEVDIDEYENAQARAGMELICNKLQKAYMRGKLSNKRVDGKFKIVLTCEAPRGSITFDELSGEHKLAMDGYDEKQNVAKQHALLGSMSGLGAKAIEKLSPADLSISECLATVFFAS